MDLTQSHDTHRRIKNDKKQTLNMGQYFLQNNLQYISSHIWQMHYNCIPAQYFDNDKDCLSMLH